jgi:hypothetical protein
MRMDQRMALRRWRMDGGGPQETGSNGESEVEKMRRGRRRIPGMEEREPFCLPSRARRKGVFLGSYCV